jgi:hypothetical protein
MKKLLVVAVLVMVSAVMAQAAPFLVCDPQPGVAAYKLTGWLIPQVNAEADGSIKLDVSQAVSGTTRVTVAPCVINPLWGEACAGSVPFDLERPAAPSVSTGIKLVP